MNIYQMLRNVNLIIKSLFFFLKKSSLFVSVGSRNKIGNNFRKKLKILYEQFRI